MININNVTGFIMHGDYVYDADEVKREWNDYTDKEKEGWYTTKSYREKFCARNVLEDLFEHAGEEMYEDADEKMFESVTNEQFKRLQEILDDITKDDSFLTYYEDELIDKDSKMYKEIR
ncbi:hypothetical protein [Microaceticoccus formicicus]|uniref:hypothetical protein n=1 Tax=Microaceticoccus formicicus TaxID=3118105 RepID=UPI003CD02BE0|nr:hypothetical protein VZL98_01590 [Peptoniphilaceae bacterium AMB_02]